MAYNHCGCGHSHPHTFDGTDPAYRRVLWLVIFLNASLFVIEMLAGHLGNSKALQADALDFLGDTLTYGLSLAVIGMAARIRTQAAVVKGLSLFAMGAWVWGSTLYYIVVGDGLPHAEVMGIIGFLALSANVASVLLLMRYKDGDANVRSVWLCSRNDAIGNCIVMLAAAGVWQTTSAWPDLAVALVMGGLFLQSSSQILRQSLREWRALRG